MFSYFCRHGNLEEAMKYYHRKPNCLNELSDGWTPLFHAVFGGHVDIVHWLLIAGADKMARCPETNYTVLHLAAKMGNLTMIEELCLSGIDRFALSKNDEIAEELAKEKGHLLCVQYLHYS